MLFIWSVSVADLLNGHPQIIAHLGGRMLHLCGVLRFCACALGNSIAKNMIDRRCRLAAVLLATFWVPDAMEDFTADPRKPKTEKVHIPSVRIDVLNWIAPRIPVYTRAIHKPQRIGLGVAAEGGTICGLQTSYPKATFSRGSTASNPPSRSTSGIRTSMQRSFQCPQSLEIRFRHTSGRTSRGYPPHSLLGKSYPSRKLSRQDPKPPLAKGGGLK